MKKWNQTALAEVGISINWPAIIDRKPMLCVAIMFGSGNPRDGMIDHTTDPRLGFMARRDCVAQPLKEGESLADFTVWRKLSDLMELEP